MKDYQSKLMVLLGEIDEELRETSYLTGISALSPKVLNAFKKIPRHLFVPPEEEGYAYLNSALLIGEGQTISQPFIVALMTELLDVQVTDKVLEVGTGSGYQAAILSQLADEVYTVDVFPSLVKQAQKLFKELGCSNVHAMVQNGMEGWEEHSPYNKIIVTAAVEGVPSALINQLSCNGIMVAPLYEEGEDEFLTIIRKDVNGELSQKSLLSVRFVPFL